MTNMVPAPIKRQTPILVLVLILTFHNKTAGKAAQMKSVMAEMAAMHRQSRDAEACSSHIPTWAVMTF